MYLYVYDISVLAQNRSPVDAGTEDLEKAKNNDIT